MGFRYVFTNLSKRRKELFSLIPPQIKRKTTLAGATQTGTPLHFGRAPECGVANPVRARTVAPRAGTCETSLRTFRQSAESRQPLCGMHPRASKRGVRKRRFFRAVRRNAQDPFFRRKEKSEEGRMGFPLCTNKLQQWVQRTFPLRPPQFKRKTYNPIHPQYPHQMSPSTPKAAAQTGGRFPNTYSCSSSASSCTDTVEIFTTRSPSPMRITITPAALRL